MMIDNSSIQILKTFSDEELLQFEEFICASINNKNKKVIQLLSLLKKHHPLYSDKNLTKEILFAKLNKSGRFRESYIRNLFSDLTILAEKFLQYSLISKNYTFERLLIEEFKNRDLHDLAEKKIKSFEKKIGEIKARDQEYYLNKSFIYEMKSFLVVDKTLTDSFRNEQISSIINLFMITLMENSFYLRVEEQRVAIKHSFGFLKNALIYIKNNIEDFKDSPLLMIHFYLCMYFIYKNDEKYFSKAKEYFKKHFNALTKIDKKNIYSMMQVYYIDKLDAGDDSHTKEFLNFMLDMLKFNVLSHKEYDFINLNLYRNILLLCLMVKEENILNRFIRKYINFISDKSRPSVLAYSNAHLEFLRGNFEKTLELCNKIDFNDLLISTNDNLFFKCDIRTLILKSLYELNLFETALSNIDAYRHFLRNSRLMKESSRRKHSNFLNIATELIKCKVKFNEFEFHKLKNKFENEKDVAQQNWISEKLKEFNFKDFKKQ